MNGGVSRARRTSSVTKVLLVHDYRSLGGGAELVVHELRSSLRRLGADARMIASNADAAVAGTEPEYTFAGGTGRLRALREVINPSAVLSLRHVLREFQPDGVYLAMFLTQASPAILSLLAEPAVVWAPNEFRPVCPRGTRLLPDRSPCEQPVGRACLASRCFRPWGLAPRLMQLSLLRRWRHTIDRTLPPSRAFENILAMHGIPVDGVLPYAVPQGTVPRSRHPTPIFAMAGRLVPEKGADIALRAFATITTRHPAARMWIAGDGPERGTLEDLAVRLGVASAIDFLGHLPRAELERAFSAAWVQCVPSLWHEPFGLVTLEALARGTPVVASAVGAQPELVSDGETGFLVPPSDPMALADVACRLIADPAAADRIGDAARTMVMKTHDPDTIARRLLTEFEEIRV